MFAVALDFGECVDGIGEAFEKGDHAVGALGLGVEVRSDAFDEADDLVVAAGLDILAMTLSRVKEIADGGLPSDYFGIGGFLLRVDFFGEFGGGGICGWGRGAMVGDDRGEV